MRRQAKTYMQITLRRKSRLTHELLLLLLLLLRASSCVAGQVGRRTTKICSKTQGAETQTREAREPSWRLLTGRWLPHRGACRVRVSRAGVPAHGCAFGTIMAARQRVSRQYAWPAAHGERSDL